MNSDYENQIPIIDTHLVMSIRTGKLYPVGSDYDGESVVPVLEAEPHFYQYTKSAASPRERTEDGRYDRSHLSPEHAFRLGRDYLAHCIRYGWPLNVIREYVGPGGRILDVGCGKEIPMFRALTMDHSALLHYKPSLYVAADLNSIAYNPSITGCKTVLLPRTNIIDNPAAVPDSPFDIITTFEVLEHMGKPDGEIFLDALFEFARRKVKAEKKPCIILLSTPVNGGKIAKNHIYEWHRSELARAFTKRRGKIVGEFGTFSNLHELTSVLTKSEIEVWNNMTKYHSPHTLSCLFSAMHPEAARNIAWHVVVDSM